MAQLAHVLYCVEFDAALNCTSQAWLPAPSLLPNLPPAEVGLLLGATAVLFAMAWGAKRLRRTVTD